MKTFIVILCLFVIASDGCFFKRGHNKRKETIFDVVDKVFSKPKEPVCESVLPIIKNKIKEKNRDILRLEDQLKVKDEKLKICTERNRNWENKQNKRAVGKQEVEKLNMKIKELSNQLKKQSQAYELLLLEKQNTIDYLLQITQEMEESQMELTELYNVIEEYKKEKRKDSLTISSLNAIIKLQRAILRKSAQPQPQSIVSSDVPKQLEDCKSNLTDITERERTKDNQIKELNEALTLSQNSEEQLKNTLSEMEQQFQEKESGWVDDIKTLEKKLNIAENRLNEKEEKLQHLVSKVQKKCQAEVNRITAENAELQSKIEELMNKDKDNSEKSEEPNDHQYKSYPNKRISHQTRVAHGFKDEDECRLICNDNIRCKAFYVDTIAGICYTTEKPIKESIVDSLRSSMSFNLFEQNVWIKLEDTNQV